MEFWQFHPTGVAGAGVLLTEGCRGEGAMLNSEGERFMERYAPTLKDLAPRDFVSRSMDQEIKEGRGCGPNKDYILLELDHLGADTIRKRLPSSWKSATTSPTSTSPRNRSRRADHPLPDGRHPDQHPRPGRGLGRQQNNVVNGLYAVGECSCVSVHGANRLGTNSLLDLVVFGRAAGNHIVDSSTASALTTKCPPTAPTARWPA
jgi:succinate dehydrogenase / fumarate reductase flavoprotein subunit